MSHANQKSFIPLLQMVVPEGRMAKNEETGFGDWKAFEMK